METRPKLKIPLSGTDKFIELIGWLTLLLLWVLTCWKYSSLPDTIPTHYNAAGQTDSYGNKVTILFLPIIGTVLFIILTILNKYPHIFNYPVKVTAGNAERLYTIATRMIRLLKLILALVFLTLLFREIQTVTGKSNGLGSWFLPLMIALTFIPMTYFIIKLVKAKNQQ